MFCLIALAAAVVQYSGLSHFLITPDLCLALAAWAMVDGTADGVVVRAWIAGVCADLLDPGSDYFHALGYLGLALMYLPLRGMMFRTRMLGWAGWAAACSLILAVVDRHLSAPGDGTWMTMTANALLTGVAAIAIGWLFRGLPGGIHPIGRGGA